ncbi:MAG: hypothetical protein WCI59_18170 [Betaproteobacteria bacterium]
MPPLTRLQQPGYRHHQALSLWSSFIQAAAGVVLALSAVLLLAPSWGEAFFYLVYFQQPASPFPVPAEVLGYLRFANGIIGAVMAGWMMVIIVLARGPFRAGERWAWQAMAWPLLGWYVIDTAFSMAHGVWGNVLLNTGTGLMFGVPLLASRRHFV